jgi:hypothetical protein
MQNTEILYAIITVNAVSVINLIAFFKWFDESIRNQSVN